MTTVYDWAGRVGDVWADEWRRTDLSFNDLSPQLNAAILAAAPETGLAVDIGCGAGGTSIALASARPKLSIVGIDLSARLVAAARDRGAHRPNLRFQIGDATELGGLAPDMFFSRHGVMFFDDPVAAFTRFRAAAKPDARLVFSCFDDVDRNPWATEAAAAITGRPPARPGTAPGPFAFADPDYVRDILAASGWHGDPQPISYTHRAGQGGHAVEEALTFFSRIGPAAAQLRDLDDAARGSGLRRLHDMLATRLHDGAVDFPAAAWIWSCRAA